MASLFNYMSSKKSGSVKYSFAGPSALLASFSHISQPSWYQQTLHNSLAALQNGPGLHPAFWNAIFRACWAIVQLLTPSTMNGWHNPAEILICERMCGLFVELSDGSDHLRGTSHLKATCLISFGLITRGRKLKRS